MDASDLSMRFGAALLVFGLLAAFLWLLRRYRDRYLYGSSSVDPAIRMCGEINLGLRQRLVLVHVEGRSLVLAVSPDRIQPVGEWAVPEVTDAGA
jgi:flagellar biogenesis protein FliO